MNKKYFLVMILLVIVFSLSSCEKPISILEEKVKEFDYYTEIVAFEHEQGINIKLLVAYDSDSTEVTYIYYSENTQSDLEVLFKLDDEIIYEDFIVREYHQNEDFIGEFTGSSIALDDEVTKIEMWLIHAGFSNAEHVGTSTFYQEFNLIKSTADLASLNRNFVSTDNYYDSKIQVIEDDLIVSRSAITFATTIFCAIIIYFALLKYYRKYYGRQIQKKLDGEANVRSIPDLNTFKYISAIVIVILVVIVNIIGAVYIQSTYNKVDFYDKYNVNYETYVSDKINLSYGGTNNLNQNIAFVEKNSTHRIMGYLYIVLDDGMTSIAPKQGNSGSNYQISYSFIQSNNMIVMVKDWNTDTDDWFLEEIFKRVLSFDEFR